MYETYALPAEPWKLVFYGMLVAQLANRAREHERQKDGRLSFGPKDSHLRGLPPRAPTHTLAGLILSTRRPPAFLLAVCGGTLLYSFNTRVATTQHSQDLILWV